MHQRKSIRWVKQQSQLPSCKLSSRSILNYGCPTGIYPSPLRLHAGRHHHVIAMPRPASEGLTVTRSTAPSSPKTCIPCNPHVPPCTTAGVVASPARGIGSTMGAERHHHRVWLLKADTWTVGSYAVAKAKSNPMSNNRPGLTQKRFR